jgi:hypothetical protein
VAKKTHHGAPLSQNEPPRGNHSFLTAPGAQNAAATGQGIAAADKVANPSGRRKVRHSLRCHGRACQREQTLSTAKRLGSHFRTKLPELRSRIH